ncbi:hypothetical protein [Candidatus Nanohalococcus occultus]|uniref:Archaeal Type IV pilin N-terminal domain-containing protein n=1 Tax=Candidatus Nanohalococcus occultus TaxID=2978047 RepID=A0ABY8CKX2_9ARCH|nr:hypothetical protein SVXNc_0966 [Candidatus Nanohaloarchaeota archaeon SVXNc]
MKGISSIVSSVMVLAVAITMVGIFSGWAPNVLNDVLDSTEGQTTNQTTCNQASLDIISASYYSGGQTAVVVENTSNVDIGTVRVSAWKNGVPMSNTEELLDEGLETINVSTSSRPAYVRASSLNCNSVSTEFSDIQ